MDDPGVYYANENSQTEKKKLYYFTYMQNLKKQNKRINETETDS